MDGWTVIPRALYENDLSDLDLQELYVREAEKKWRELAARREALERELEHARFAEVQAAAFVTEARAALEKYRRQAEAETHAHVEEASEARFLPGALRALPKSKGRRGQR
jgi:hypothetical protein